MAGIAAGGHAEEVADGAPIRGVAPEAALVVAQAFRRSIDDDGNEELVSRATDLVLALEWRHNDVLEEVRNVAAVNLGLGTAATET